MAHKRAYYWYMENSEVHHNGTVRMKEKLRIFFTKGLQKALMTIELFGKNELANHAAAGAYGFLLSAAPVFIMAAILITRAFGAWPEWVTSLVGEIELLASNFDIEVSLRDILDTKRIGIPALITGINLLWTARVFALSLQRGTRTVFLTIEPPSVLRENTLTFLIEIAVVFYAMAYAVSSRLTLSAVRRAGIFLQLPILDPALELISLLLPIAGLGILTWLAYRLIPFEHPSAKAALRGSILCVGLYSLVSFGFRELIDITRYNLLYGTLGNLLILLANVYFFFIFFYWGAQYAFVEDSFDELSFQHYRRVSHVSASPGPLERRVFSKPKKLMQNYARLIADGEYLYQCGDNAEVVFYIVRGVVSILRMDASGKEIEDSFIREGGFVGETEVLLEQKRTTSAQARGETHVLGLPPELFQRVLHTDPESALHIIEDLSKRVNRLVPPEVPVDPDSDRDL